MLTVLAVVEEGTAAWRQSLNVARQRSTLFAATAQVFNEQHRYTKARLFALAGLPTGEGLLIPTESAAARAQLLRAE